MACSQNDAQRFKTLKRASQTSRSAVAQSSADVRLTASPREKYKSFRDFPCFTPIAGLAVSS